MRRLCNTTNLHSGADRFRTPAGLAGWLTEQGLPAIEPGARELARVVALREAVRSAAVAHRSDQPDQLAMSTIAGIVGAVALSATFERAGHDLAPASSQSRADQLLGALALLVVQARADGTWERFKACGECQWVFFDGSKNRSGRWCSMRACGGRAKVRNHRARRRAE